MITKLSDYCRLGCAHFLRKSDCHIVNFFIAPAPAHTGPPAVGGATSSEKHENPNLFELDIFTPSPLPLKTC